jgi:MFS family permease
MLVIAVVVFQLTGSALLVATMTLLRVAPMGLFGALIGVLADRLPRRGALIGILAMQAGAVGAMGISGLLGLLDVWQVAIGCVIGGLGWATDNPVRRMLIGEAVGAARMGPAMSLDVMANNASRVAGPALGGTLLAALGPGEAFGLAFLCYIAAIALSVGIGVGAAPAAARGAPLLGQLREGFALALGHPPLRGVIVVTVLFNLFAWPATSMVPVIAQEAFGLDPGGVGVLASMDGLGALLGAALIGVLGRPERYGWIYVGGTALYLGAMAAFALAPGAVAAGVLLVVVGIGGAGFATMQATLTYLVAPEALRGRTFGVLSTAIGTGLLGFLQIGLLAEWMGAAAATVLVGGQGLFAMMLTFPLWVGLLRRERMGLPTNTGK